MKIKTGDPSKNGVYVAYVSPRMELSIWPDKMFLSWYENQWYHTGSDQKYRDTVYGFLGPLPSMRMRDLGKRKDKNLPLQLKTRVLTVVSCTDLSTQYVKPLN